MSFIKKASHAQTAGVTIILLLVGLSIYKLGHHHNAQTTSTQQTVTIAPSGIKYPAGWSELLTISTADQTDGVVSEAGRSNPSAIVIVRTVQQPLPKAFDINTLPAQTVTSLKQGLADFRLESSGLKNIGSYRSVQIIYKSTADNGKGNEAISLIVPTANKVFYVTISSSATDFSKITTDVNSIETAIVPYINTHLN